jgi:hypothetical protein
MVRASHYLEIQIDFWVLASLLLNFRKYLPLETPFNGMTSGLWTMHFPWDDYWKCSFFEKKQYFQ